MITRDEYRAQLSKLELEARKRKEAYLREVAYINNTVKIGDVITGKRDTIIVERMSPALTFGGFPEMHYYGRRLTKKGVPYKDGQEVCVCQWELESRLI